MNERDNHEWERRVDGWCAIGERIMLRTLLFGVSPSRCAGLALDVGRRSALTNSITYGEEPRSSGHGFFFLGRIDLFVTRDDSH